MPLPHSWITLNGCYKEGHDDQYAIFRAWDELVRDYSKDVLVMYLYGLRVRTYIGGAK